jgi:peptidoglycan/LPS O-acetylase OafA/YrhL
MNSTVLVITLMVVGMVAGKLLLRRFPKVRKSQIFCATVAWIGGVLIAGRPGGSDFWHYTGLTVAVIMGTFLLMVFLRRLDAPPPTGSV